MHEVTTAVDGGEMYCRHTEIDAARPTVLFVHGLGESGLCFLESFHDPLLNDFNIIAPDLLGFGRSSPAEEDDYAFSQQINRMCSLLDHIGVDQVSIVGHSMGGDIGTLFCHEQGDRVVSFVNIEGDLTSDDRFITDPAIQSEKDGRFEEWLQNDFAERQVIDWCHKWPTTVRYLASLHMCECDAFLSSVHQIYELNEALPGKKVGLIGAKYVALDKPSVFCWGTDSLSEGAQAILREHALEHRPFVNAFHWVMLDQPAQFYAFLAWFLSRSAKTA